MTLRPALLLITAAAVSATAHADDAPGHEIAPGRRIEGEARAGLRLISGEGEGRYPQDEGWRDGLRLFELHFLYTDEREEASLDEIELSAYGVGDPNTDTLLSLRKLGRFDVDAGFRRDDYSYRATGDPYPYDTIRKQAFARARLVARKDLALRFEFDRTTRRGDSFTSADSAERELPPPAGVDEDLVRDRRPLDQRYDTWLAGAEGGRGIWRYGVTQTVHYDVIDDERAYDIPAPRRGTDPVRELFRRKARNKAYTTTAKIGVSPLEDRTLDVNVIYAFTRSPNESDLGTDAAGFDNTFAAGTPRGTFTSRTDGGSRVSRSVTSWRAEALWYVDPVEFTAAAEKHDIVDDASLHLTEQRAYERLDVPSTTTHRTFRARITDRTERYSIDAVWEVHPRVHLRGGQEYLHQQLQDPTNTRRSSFNPTDLDSTSWRSTAGVDWDPTERLDLSFLYRWSDNDEPYASTSAKDAEEASFRGRWKATDELFLSVVYRLKDFEHERRFDSTTRSESASVSVTWAPGRFSTSANATFHDFDTRTSTRFFELQGVAFRRLRDDVVFRSRDLTATWEASYAWTDGLRSFVNGTFNRTTGDYHARYREATLGTEYDLRPNLSVGASVRIWDFNEKGRRIDDYDATGLELWLTYRF